ncbi:MAG: META domain-containing protein [Anaerolineae bacterium]|nr:META domain-containing protein [Anaerolineae bacterium]
MRRKMIVVGLWLALAMLGTACAPGRLASGEVEPAADSPATSVGLDGTQWNVIAIDGETVNAKGQGTLDFADGQVSGTAFCNSFGGSYNIEGDTLTLGQLVSTLMACEDMGPETEYFAALAKVASYRMDGANLVLSDDSGADLIVLSPAKPASLEGTVWALTGLNTNGGISSPLLNSEVTATFVDGSMSGSAGCNRYFASYTRDGNALTLGPAGSTKMACLDPAGVMEQEQAFLAALGKVVAYETKCASLTLFDAEGTVVMTFQADRG